MPNASALLKSELSLVMLTDNKHSHLMSSFQEKLKTLFALPTSAKPEILYEKVKAASTSMCTRNKFEIIIFSALFGLLLFTGFGFFLLFHRQANTHCSAFLRLFYILLGKIAFYAFERQRVLCVEGNGDDNSQIRSATICISIQHCDTQNVVN